MFLPKYDPAYDPVESLDRKGVRIVRHSLNDHNAVWVPERRMVIVDRGLRADLYKPTLAHEDDHVINDDPAGHLARIEARANLHSALRLTDPELWADLTRFTSDYDQMCLEIGITRRQFRAYYEHKRKTDSSQIRLQRIGDTIYVNPRMGAGQWSLKVSA